MTQQDAGRRIEGRARCQHIVDKHDGAALNFRPHDFRHNKSALHIQGTLTAGQINLGRRRFDSLKQEGIDRDSVMGGNRLRENIGLIIAPFHQAPPMHRNRDHDIGLGQNIGASPRHP